MKRMSKCFWQASTSVLFSTKSVWNLVKNNQFLYLKSPTKWFFYTIAWRMLHNKLPVDTALT